MADKKVLAVILPQKDGKMERIRLEVEGILPDFYWLQKILIEDGHIERHKKYMLTGHDNVSFHAGQTLQIFELAPEIRANNYAFSWET